MKKSLLLFFLLLIISSCSEKPSNSKKVEQKEAEKPEQSDFRWLAISGKDSVKFKGFSTRVFNQGRDSVVFAHYISDLYKSIDDAKNPLFKKQSILVLNALAKKTNLPDSIYVQAMGVKKGTIIKKSSDFNIFSAFDGTEWHILDGELWKSLNDYEN